MIHGELDQKTGGYIYDRTIVEGLRAGGDLVDVVSVEPGGDPEEIAARLGAVWSKVDRRSRPWLSGQDAIVGDALAVTEFGAALARLDRSFPGVLLVHHLTSWENDAPNRPVLRADESRAIALSDHLVATSKQTADRLAAEHGRTADVVAPGSDRLGRSARPPQARTGASRVVLVFAGSIIPRKRLPLLLDAMERLADPRIELRILGDTGRDRDHARAVRAQMSRSSYLSAHAVLLGAVEDDAFARELASADALVLPSSLEGYGMVLTEALHAGVPVIAARAAAAPEALGAAGRALLFDDRAGLVEALARFVSDGALREHMRAAAVASWPELPTWDGAVLAFRAALKRAVAIKARAPSSARAR